MLRFAPNLPTKILSQCPRQTNIDNNQPWLLSAEGVHRDETTGDTDVVAGSL